MPGKFQVVLYPSQTNHISSHYVAFIRKELPDDKSKSWILYNDEKVVKANDVEEMKKFAYVYFFKRV
jgi:ubiquitin carboxyl-terminal hydrolase 5/13